MISLWTRTQTHCHSHQYCQHGNVANTKSKHQIEQLIINDCETSWEETLALKKGICHLKKALIRPSTGGKVRWWKSCVLHSWEHAATQHRYSARANLCSAGLQASYLAATLILHWASVWSSILYLPALPSCFGYSEPPSCPEHSGWQSNHPTAHSCLHPHEENTHLSIKGLNRLLWKKSPPKILVVCFWWLKMLEFQFGSFYFFLVAAEQLSIYSLASVQLNTAASFPK